MSSMENTDQEGAQVKGEAQTRGIKPEEAEGGG